MIRIKTNITPSSKVSLRDLYDKIKELPDKEHRVFICDEKNTRSLQQNKYYWGVVLPLIKAHTGYSVEELHDICKFKFNKKIFTDPETGEVMDIGASTSTLKTNEFTDYIEAIRDWAKDIGVIIPEAGELPDEVLILHNAI